MSQTDGPLYGAAARFRQFVTRHVPANVGTAVNGKGQKSEEGTSHNGAIKSAFGVHLAG